MSRRAKRGTSEDEVVGAACQGSKGIFEGNSTLQLFEPEGLVYLFSGKLFKPGRG